MSLKVMGWIVPKQHITLKLSQYILQLTNDFLNRYSLNGFRHVRLYADNTRFELTTDPIWYTHFMEQGYFNLFPIERLAEIHLSQVYQSGYILWDANQLNYPQYNKIIRDAIQNFSGGRGLSIIKKHRDWIDRYDFSAPLNNELINSFFISNINLFEGFIAQYEKKAKQVIQQTSS